MQIAQRTITRFQSFLKSYGPTNIKKLLWDHEFSGEKWNFIDNTEGDCVYPHLEKYARGGNILDLGCGPGNTANELASGAYKTYVGVDISEAALWKAVRRSKENSREDRNQFVQGDFLSYVPSSRVDVILFRESLYHVPPGRVKQVLEHYAQYLNEQGVFIVRMGTEDSEGNVKRRPHMMLEIIEENFPVVERAHYRDSGITVIVFRGRTTSSKSATL